MLTRKNELKAKEKCFRLLNKFFTEYSKVIHITLSSKKVVALLSTGDIASLHKRCLHVCNKILVLDFLVSCTENCYTASQLVLHMQALTSISVGQKVSCICSKARAMLQVAFGTCRNAQSVHPVPPKEVQILQLLDTCHQTAPEALRSGVADYVICFTTLYEIIFQ